MSLSSQNWVARKHRLLLILGVLAYVYIFQWVYVHYLFAEWSYFGFEYYPPGGKYLLFAWILASLPSLWMPIRLNRPSQLIYWVLYISVIIPSCFVPFYAGLDSAQDVSKLVLALFAGFAIVGCSHLIPLRRVRPPLISPAFFWSAVGTLIVCLSLWMVVVFRHDLHVVSFNDVYYLRDAADDIAEHSKVKFAFMLTTGALYPFLIGCGLYYRQIRLIAFGAAGQLLIYSIAGTKGSILSILFLSGMYYLLQRSRITFGLRFLYGMLTLLAGAGCAYAATSSVTSGTVAMLFFVILMRTFAINGLVTAQYFNFFQKNPVTHFSHVTGVSWLVHYPYTYPLGTEIGLEYQGTTGLDQTGHFWAMDGIAGMGLIGVILISILCAVVFWFLDSASHGHDPTLPALLSTYEAYNLANIPLFTSLWSGGLGLLMVLLYWLPRREVSLSRQTFSLAPPEGVQKS